MAELNQEEPWKLISDPVLLSMPEYGWANNIPLWTKALLPDNGEKDIPDLLQRDGGQYLCGRASERGSGSGFVGSKKLDKRKLSADVLQEQGG